MQPFNSENCLHQNFTELHFLRPHLQSPAAAPLLSLPVLKNSSSRPPEPFPFASSTISRLRRPRGLNMTNGPLAAIPNRPRFKIPGKIVLEEAHGAWCVHAFSELLLSVKISQRRSAYVMTTFAHVYLQRSASFKNIKSLKIGTNETLFTQTALIFKKHQGRVLGKIQNEGEIFSGYWSCTSISLVGVITKKEYMGLQFLVYFHQEAADPFIGENHTGRFSCGFI